MPVDSKHSQFAANHSVPSPSVKGQNARLRICLLSYRSNPHCGGQGVYIRNLSRALIDLGHQVTVLSGPPEPELDPDIPVVHIPGLDLYNPNDLFRMPSFRELTEPLNLFEWIGVSTMGFPEPAAFGFRALQYLRRHPGRFDIIHDNQSLSYGVYAVSRYFPTVATIHHPITVDRRIAVQSATTTWEKLKQMRWYSFISMQKRVARTLPGILTVSKSARSDISREFNIPESRIRVAPNGIDTKRFRPVSGIHREQNRIIVTNSADSPLKGLAHLLHAVASVIRTHPVKLVVVGEPKKNGTVRQLIGDLELGDQIVFTGRIANDRFVEEYAKASMAVVPSVYEGFGLPVGEAMACGVPVISTSGGALPEVVGTAGILVPPASPSALAEAIIHLLDHPREAIRLGKAGAERVHRHFSWEAAAQSTVAAYREVINGYRRV